MLTRSMWSRDGSIERTQRGEVSAALRLVLLTTRVTVEANSLPPANDLLLRLASSLSACSQRYRAERFAFRWEGCKQRKRPRRGVHAALHCAVQCCAGKSFDKASVSFLQAVAAAAKREHRSPSPL